MSQTRGVKSTRAALAWSLGERYFGLIVTLGTTMVLSRLLTPNQVGVFSLCAAVMAIAATIRDFGISEYIIQERDLTEQRMRQAFAVAIGVAWGVGLVIFLLRDSLAAYYHEPQLGSIIAILCISFAVLPLSSPAYALLNRQMEFRKIMAVQSISGVTGSLTSIALAFHGFGAVSLAWGSVGAILAQIIAVSFVRPKGTFLVPSFRGAGEIVRFGSFQVSSRVIESATSNLHEFIIARYFGFAAVGLFSRAKGLTDMFHSNVTMAVTRVVTPDMAAALRSGNSVTGSFARGTAVFTSISWLFFGTVAIAAPEIIHVMFGRQWASAAPAASTLAIAMLPTALFALSGSVMSAMGKVERRLWVTAQWCPVHIIGLLLTAQLGFQAMAVAWGLTNTFIAWLFARQVAQLLKAGFRQLYAPSLVSLPVCALAALVQFFVVQFGRSRDWGPLWIVAAAGFVGLLTWYLTALALGHPVLREVQRAQEWLARKVRG